MPTAAAAMSPARSPPSRRPKSPASATAPMPWGLALRNVVEVDKCAGQGLGERQIIGEVLEQYAHIVEVHVEIAPGDGVLRRVVAEQGATGDSGGGGDLVDAGVVEAAAVEQIDRHVGYPCLRCDRSSTHRTPFRVGNPTLALCTLCHYIRT